MATIHPRGRRFSYSLSLGWFHTDRSLLERFSAARQDGFGAVELFWPAGVDYRQVAAAARREHVRISMFNMYEGDYARGERGFAADPDRVDEWRARFLEALDFAVLSDCADINVLAGDIPEGRSRAVGMDCLVENMRWAALEACAQGRRILVEPLNRSAHRNYACRDTDEAMRVVEACRSDNVVLLYDVYHAQLTEGNVISTLSRIMGRIGHVQIADVPTRGRPGTGELNFANILGALVDLGYSGYVGLEYDPAGDSDPLGWLPVSERGQAERAGGP